MGGSHPYQVTHIFHVLGTEFIEGYDTAIWPRGSNPRQEQVSFWLQEWQGIGGAAAKSLLATQYLLKQLEELVANRDMQPAYIQWTATAQAGATLNASELHDGWYVINELKPDYERFIVSGIVNCTMTVTEVAPAPPRRVAMAYMGGAISTNYSGTALNFLSVPVGSSVFESSVIRTAAEGSISCILSPAASPEPVLLSATLANMFKGGCHVYDTINTGSNPVPTSGGTFVNANWVEVFFASHDFVGDCVVTNGLQLLLFQVGSNPICTAYLWNTALASANWQQWATLQYVDNAGNAGPERNYTLTRVGPEEVAITAVDSTSGPNAAAATIRLQRGRVEGRVDFRPLTQAATSNNGLELTVVAVPKIIYNSTKVCDNVLSETSPAVATDYGYGACFVASTSQPFICGFLYQNEPGGSQPFSNGNSANIGFGDNTSLAVNAQRSYGFFAIPYGSSGSFSTANLQAEAESGALGTGWTNAVDAAASGGHTANLASGTLSTNADLWGTSFIPTAGVYDLWVRMKTTAAASTVAQLQIGLWDVSSTAFVNSTTYAPSQTTTSYAWYRVSASVTPTATHNMQIRAVTTVTTTDAWQIDESALVPRTLTVTDSGPQDLWQHFAYDRSTRLVRQ